MFSTGRIIFTLIFLFLFIAGMIWAYRKDMQQVRGWFQRPWVILISILVILFIYVIFTRVVTP